MDKYTSQEEKELNKQLKKWQNRAKRLISHNYYDVVANSLTHNDINILSKITNAETHKDINTYLWNSGVIESVLDKVAKRIQLAKKDCG